MYILSIDQGTSGTKAIIFNSKANIVSKAYVKLKSYYPKIGYIEQDPQEIYCNVLESVSICLKNFTEKISPNCNEIEICGITNQRETFIIWDKYGNPLYKAISWQCKRSIEICERLKKELDTRTIDEIALKTGLIIDPYFSATKLIWLKENVDEVKAAIIKGEAFFGTIDTWILYKLTKCKKYFTDYTNASRTLFFNINNLKWDEFLLEIFDLKNLKLPSPKPSSFYYGESNFDGLFDHKIQIMAMIGDSHAAAFGECCYKPGLAKVTMGTGSSILMNIGKRMIKSKKGMVTTICWSTSDCVDYALEGIIVTAGATINWLKDNLNLFKNNEDTEEMARAVENNNGIYLIPAFSGLGAPHWKMNTKAAIFGLTFDSNKNHIVRAALESIPYQIKDVVSAMEEDTGITLKEIMADGGLTSNQFVMQFLADLLNTKVTNIGIEEVSALGAAYLAMLKHGIFKNLDQLQKLCINKKQFCPKENNYINKYYQGWIKSLKGIN